MNTGIVHVDRSDEPTFIHSELDEAGLSVFAFRIYCHLKRRSGKNGFAWPGSVTMARVCIMGKNSVLAAVAELEGRGMLRVERCAKGSLESNTYHLLGRAHWTPAPERSAPAARGGRKKGAVCPANAPNPVCPANNDGLPGKHEGEQLRETILKNSGLSIPAPTGPPPARPEYDLSPIAPGQVVQIDMLAPAGIRDLWEKWQKYRTGRHNAKGKEKLAWNVQSAEAAASSIMRALDKHGEELVTDRILLALEKRWEGLNMQTLGQAYTPTNSTHGKTHSRPNPGPGSKFEVLNKPPAGVPDDYGADFTGEIR
jgi:hypothetical protein